MSNDDTSRKRLVFTWESVRHQGKKAVAWTIGLLLKLGGILGTIYGLLTIALAGMDIDPNDSIVWGVSITCVGLLLLYFGHKIATKAKWSST